LRNVRAVLAGTPRGLVVAAGVIAILFSWLALANTIEPLSRAQTCTSDWEAIIDAAQAGQSSYEGSCVSIGGLEQYRDDQSALYEQRDAYRADLETEALRLTDNLWETVGGYLGGFPTIVFASLIGAFVVGSSLASGLTAWCISNGWRRQDWIKAAVGLIVSLAAAGYLVLTVAGVLLVHFRVRGLGIESGFPTPGPELLAPISGLLFYGLLAAGIALLVGRGEMALLLAIGFLALDYIGSAQFERAPYFPSSFHSGALGAPDAKVGIWTGSMTMLGLAFLVGLAVYLHFVRRKDLPDR
jgi:hypothetical protein